MKFIVTLILLISCVLTIQANSSKPHFTFGKTEIIPKLKFGLDYDSNVFADNEKEVDDFVYSVAPSLAFRSDLDGPINFKALYQYTWVKYAETDSQDFNGQLLNFGLNSEKGFYHYSIDGAWKKDRKIISTTINEYDVTDSYKVSGLFDRNSSFSLISAMISYETLSYDRKEFKISDRDTLAGLASYSQIFSMIALGLELGYQKESFKSGLNDSQQVALNFVAKYNHSKLTNAILKLGYKTILYKDKATDDEDGLNASLSVDFKQSDFIQYDLSSGYQLSTDTFGASEKTFSNQVSVSFDDKLKYGASCSIKRDDINQESFGRSSIMEYSLKFTYKGVPYLDFALGARYLDKKDDFGGYNQLLIEFSAEASW